MRCGVCNNLVFDEPNFCSLCGNQFNLDKIDKPLYRFIVSRKKQPVPAFILPLELFIDDELAYVMDKSGDKEFLLTEGMHKIELTLLWGKRISLVNHVMINQGTFLEVYFDMFGGMKINILYEEYFS